MSQDCSTCSSISESCDSCSTVSSLSQQFEAEELLQIIHILFLPLGTIEDLDIIKWKDSKIVELIEKLNNFFDLNNCLIKFGYSRIIHFINKNRKVLKKRKFSFLKFDDKEFASLIKEGLKEITNKD